MRRSLGALLAAAVLGFVACGDPPPPRSPHATSGQSKATRESADEAKVSGDGKDWGGWRYTGSRDDCFFVVGRRCFRDEAAACRAAKCGKQRCVADGGGPATMRCR